MYILNFKYVGPQQDGFWSSLRNLGTVHTQVYKDDNNLAGKLMYCTGKCTVVYILKFEDVGPCQNRIWSSLRNLGSVHMLL